MPESAVSSEPPKSGTKLMQKEIFGARKETRREVVGAAVRIGEKRKGGREGFRHLPPRHIAYFYPSSTLPPNFDLLLPSASS
jgi:hypothetical protein